MVLSNHINHIQSQKQKLILSAQMRESLDILQMPLPELLKKIETEVMENPVLEYDETTCENEPNENYIEENSILNFAVHSTVSCSAGSLDEHYDLFAALSQDTSFTDYLLEQLSELKIDSLMAKICRYIIENLNEKGYLDYRADDIVRDLKNCDICLVKKAIVIVQQLEPAGVGASNLRECLTIQLQRQIDSDPCMLQIVNNYLSLLAKNKIKEIAQKLKVSISVAQEYCNRIRTLNPIPSRGFSTGTPEKFVVPEAIITKNDCGELCIMSNHYLDHHLHISPVYFALAKNTDDQETKKYLKDKIKRATTLLMEVTNRKNTIYRILEKIVKLQPSYFDKGAGFLEPMSMRFIAGQLGLNESTVSRAIQDKFVLCSWGIISLKSLFTSQLSAQEGGRAFSSVSVKEKIKNLIASENKAQPFSDQILVLELEQAGVVISRRTVAKYRDQLNIPPALQRKTL